MKDYKEDKYNNYRFGMYDVERNNINNDSKIYKVGILITPPFVYKNPDNTYSGIIYDLWDKIKKELNIKVKEILIEDPNIDKAIDEMYKSNKYDILIGSIAVREERIKKALFSRPILLDKLTVGYKPKMNKFQRYLYIFSKVLLQPLLLLITLGILFGIVLHKFEPSRKKTRSILTTISSMFGEMGYLSENSKLELPSMFLVTIILTISFYFMIYLQAATTDSYMKLSKEFQITKNNIIGKNLLTIEGYYVYDYFRDVYEANTFTAKNIDELLHKMKTEEKYDGFILGYESSKKIAREHGYILSEEQFGNNEDAFPIHKDLIKLKQRIDNVIVKLQDDDVIYNICKKYVDKDGLENCQL